MKTLFAIVLSVLAFAGTAAAQPASRQAQNEALFQQLQSTFALSDAQMQKIRAIFAGSSMIGQGNTAVTVHPMSPEQCRARLERSAVTYDNPRFEKICGSKYLAPLYDPAAQQPEDAKACIDQFEFPNIPCTYPVVWVRAREAAEICEAQGKRMCDAHEWEGGCQGALGPADYDFGRGIGGMRSAHNARYASSKRWSYGPEYRNDVCGTGSAKSPGCRGGEWAACGSNTYPVGSFPECRSPLGVYDINGNAAEHMNLPTAPSEMASRGSTTLGVTEMKGSWFVFGRIRAHEDWCRWRAPYWHGSRVMSPGSHMNYHLGFRCCKTIK
jgi:formylglycine-generating enzyme required for sulfatase activity